MLNTRTVSGHRPRSNAPTPVISVGVTEGRQPGSLFSVQLIIISCGGTQSSNPVRSTRESVQHPILTVPFLNCLRPHSIAFIPGDIQFLHNHTILHARSAYEDWPEGERKRHLLRLWLSPPGARPLPPVFADATAASRSAIAAASSARERGCMYRLRQAEQPRWRATASVKNPAGVDAT
jgi:hypothetical protein